jgi:hypothetical protein
VQSTAVQTNSSWSGWYIKGWTGRSSALLAADGWVKEKTGWLSLLRVSEGVEGYSCRYFEYRSQNKSISTVDSLTLWWSQPTIVSDGIQHQNQRLNNREHIRYATTFSSCTSKSFILCIPLPPITGKFFWSDKSIAVDLLRWDSARTSPTTNYN